MFYQVALSFAGEDRVYVEKVALQLQAEGVKVFYDKFEEAELWGKDLYTHLSGVYKNQAQYTVMFISAAYRSKLWTNHERENVQARAFAESREYILPAFFDESIEVPGLPKTTGYISLVNKTPEQLAGLIVQKLKLSGVQLTQQFSYSEQATADADFPLPKKGQASEIIGDLKSYNWYTQALAVEKLLNLNWSTINADEAFVLGRNLYQCACGGERNANETLANLRSKLNAIPKDRCLDLVNGMFFEVYFNASGEFRGRASGGFRGHKLKAQCLNDLLALQTVKKYAPSIAFIRRQLSPYCSSLVFLPNTEPEKVTVELAVKTADPTTVRALKIGKRDLLTQDNKDSFQSFTMEDLRQHLAYEWAIPLAQLEITCKPKSDAKTVLRLPKNTSII